MAIERSATGSRPAAISERFAPILAAAATSCREGAAGRRPVVQVPRREPAQRARCRVEPSPMFRIRRSACSAKVLLISPAVPALVTAGGPSVACSTRQRRPCRRSPPPSARSSSRRSTAFQQLWLRDCRGGSAATSGARRLRRWRGGDGHRRCPRTSASSIGTALAPTQQEGRRRKGIFTREPRRVGKAALERHRDDRLRPRQHRLRPALPDGANAASLAPRRSSLPASPKASRSGYRREPARAVRDRPLSGLKKVLSTIVSGRPVPDPWRARCSNHRRTGRPLTLIRAFVVR